jgi:LysR family transcriptional activator of mexEF-oprN operon
MAAIDHFNLRSFDLNLFLAFDAIMIERNVTRAAKRLRVRQPAMSHSLSVLRMLLQDELFVRRGQTMEPTPYALHLAGPVRRVLAQAQDALTTRAKFAEISEQRTFRMAFSASLAAVILPTLFVNVRAVAPSVRLTVQEANQDSIPDILKDGRAEIGVGYFEFKQAWIRQETLFQERYVCCFNNSLLKIGPRIDLNTYFELPHVTVSTRNNQLGCLEKAFNGVGRRPNTTMSVSHFFPATTIAAHTPVLTTLPATLAMKYAAPLGLTLSPLPFDIDTCPVSMVWHSRIDGDDGTEWLRKRINEAVKQLGAETQLPDFLQRTGAGIIRIKEPHR